MGFYIFYRVQKENSYAASTIEINKGQKVISTGIYSIVRHPMYSGYIILFIFSAIALDSILGVIPGILMAGILIFRIIDEEKYLNESLNGYSEYCRTTKYRLIPYIW